MVRADPYYNDQGQANPLIVKYGRRGDIKTEADNFETYVARFMTGHRHTDLIGKAETRLLGGLAYSLIGSPLEKMRTFNEFYASSDANAICSVLDDLFSGTAVVGIRIAIADKCVIFKPCTGSQSI